MSEQEKIPFCVYSEEQLKELESHIKKHIGECKTVLHELESPDIHLDVFVIEPNENYDGYTLVTVGAGAYRMKIPEEYEHPINSRRAEFLIRLPETWELPKDLSAPEEEVDENWYWPIRWLKNVARRPVSFGTWLGWGHSVQCEAGNFAENTGFCCLLVEMPYTFGNEAFRVDIGAQEHVHFYQLIPLYREEMEYKIHNGTDALMELFEDSFSDIVDINRKNYGE